MEFEGGKFGANYIQRFVKIHSGVFCIGRNILSKLGTL